MDREEIEIIKADISHAEIISLLAKKIYCQYYLYLWKPGGADWYMNNYAYHSTVIKNELAKANNLYFIVYNKQQAIAYLKLVLQPEYFNFNPLTTLEIERIYIDQNYIQKGIGSQLLQFTYALAQQYHQKNIVLKAMDSAKSAIEFYTKNGFVFLDTYQLPLPTFALMKQKFRGMVILGKKL